LKDLLGRATTPDRVYRHRWSVGDLVIWDNTGVMHRVEPYDPSSAREMHRTTMSGDEPIR
jgi:alpha-ketoglutarate-dependent taurine dioxygenase